MKFKSKRFKKYRSLIILYTVFCILFPYSLMADDTGYKVPKRSISYFVEDTDQNQVEIVSPPAKVANKSNISVTGQAPANKSITPEPSAKEKTVPEPYTSKKTIARPTNEDEHFELSWPDSKKNIKATKTSARKPAKVVKKQKKPTIRKKQPSKPVPAKKHYQKQIKKPVKKTIKRNIAKKATARQVFAVKVSEEEPLFSKALKKMQQRSDERRAEAEKLGIVLPSQGGDMASVSPSLSKINKNVKNYLEPKPLGVLLLSHAYK